MGIFRRGPRAYVLEPSQAAAQRADITEPCQGFKTSPQCPPPPGLALPPHGPASGWALSPRLDHLSSLSRILHPLVPRCLLLPAAQWSLSNCKPNHPLPCLKLVMAR